MTGWQIDPDRVRNLVGEVALEHRRVARSIRVADTDAIVAGVEWLDALGIPLQESITRFLELQTRRRDAILNRVGVGLDGLVYAADAYDRGQTDMLDDGQRAMFAAIRTDRPFSAPPSGGGHG